MTVGEQIKLLRTALGLTRKELAEKTGTTTQIVINTECYNISKHSGKILKYLVENKELAVKHLFKCVEAIKDIKEV